jgi:anti-anti-sigma factor
MSVDLQLEGPGEERPLTKADLPTALPVEEPGTPADAVQLVCIPPAELDVATSPPFGAYLASLPATSSVVVDMSECRFADSASLRMFLMAHQRLESGGGTFTLRNISPSVQRLLEITGLDQHFRVESRLP